MISSSLKRPSWLNSHVSSLPSLQSRRRRQQQRLKQSHSPNDKDNHRDPFAHQKVVVRAESPFEILGVPKTATYQEVKRRFVELALQHHPDTIPVVKNNSDKNNNNSKDDGNVAYQDDQHKSVEHFIRFRKAFEALKEDGNGIVSARHHDDEASLLWSSDEEFNAWFYEETGHADIMFRMDMQTRKEVIHVVQSQAQGGLDHGGMWEMARRMAEQEEMLKDQKHRYPKTLVRLEAGSSATTSSSVRRRRKRGG
jgi:DnaJ-class molecular chaperone